MSSMEEERIWCREPQLLQMSSSQNTKQKAKALSLKYLSSLQLVCINLPLQVKQDSTQPHGSKRPKKGPCRQSLALPHARLPVHGQPDHAGMMSHDSAGHKPSSLSRAPRPVA